MRTGPKIALAVTALVLPCCGGVTLIGALSGPSDRERPDRVANAGAPLPAQDRIGAASAAVPAIADPGVASTPPPAPSATRSGGMERRTVTQTRAVAFRTRTVEDPRLEQGTTRVRRAGVPGVRTLTYEITVRQGREAGRRLVDSTITRAPVHRIVAVGTRVDVAACDPNYRGRCVPVASDVDCAGGGGNGPAYVDGIVRIVGTDIYHLDRDGDGHGCD